MIKVRILRWEDYAGLLRWAPQCLSEGAKEGNMKTEAALTVMRPGAKECGQPLDAGGGQETDWPLVPPEGTQSCQHLNFSPKRPIADI